MLGTELEGNSWGQKGYLGGIGLIWGGGGSAVTCPGDSSGRDKWYILITYQLIIYTDAQIGGWVYKYVGG